MEINNQKELPPEKKPSTENKNKFHALLAGGKAKKRTLSEIPPDRSEVENASEEELLDMAEKAGFDINDYIWH